jgi:stage II sporulation protein D
MNLQGMVKRAGAFFFFAVIVFTFCYLRLAPLPTGAQISGTPTSTILRVALGLDLPSAEFTVVEGNYEIVDDLTQKVIASASVNENWTVTPVSGINLRIYNNDLSVSGLASNYLVLRSVDGTGQNVFRYNNKQYRGDLLIKNSQGKLQIINLVDVEQYLYGVVGAEMGAGAPEEAYKAQAVVSRTYALYYKEHPQLNYDVGISTRWQVYGGYDAEFLSSPLVKKAVDETRGKVIYYNNKLIMAFFHSNSGGYTEACQNVWSDSLPYLQPVATREDAIAVQVAQQGNWPGESYSWEKTFTKQELVNHLAKWNREHPDNVVNVGEIQDIVVQRWAIDPRTREYIAVETDSGRVTQLDFIGSNGVKSFSRDNIRSPLGLKSTLFEIVTDSAVRIWNAFGSSELYNTTSNLNAVSADGWVTQLNSNAENYYVLGADGLVTVPKTFSTVTFKGKGYGHGLGMSQWGAYGMALKGVSYSRIIEHFYNQDKLDGCLRIGAYVPGS